MAEDDKKLQFKKNNQVIKQTSLWRNEALVESILVRRGPPKCCDIFFFKQKPRTKVAPLGNLADCIVIALTIKYYIPLLRIWSTHCFSAEGLKLTQIIFKVSPTPNAISKEGVINRRQVLSSLLVIFWENCAESEIEFAIAEIWMVSILLQAADIVSPIL